MKIVPLTYPAPVSQPLRAGSAVSLPADSSSASGFDLARILAETAPKAASLASKMKHEFVEGEVLVRLHPGLSAQDLGGFAGDYGASVIKQYRIPESMRGKMQGELVRLQLAPGMTTAQALAAMESDGRVSYAASNDIVTATPDEPVPERSCCARQESQPTEPRLPNDLDSRQWALSNTGQTGGTAGADIGAPMAWSIATGQRQDGPIIALVDSGIDYNHADLNANMWRNPGETADGQDNDGNGIVDDVYGACFHPHHGDPKDDNRHGTHIAGIIGADTNNGQGVAGVMWETRLMAVKFLEKSGRGKISEAIEGILYATEKGARITTQAWGSTVHNQALFEVLGASPALHICAAGNDRQDNDAFPIYPGNFDLPNMITVASSTHEGKLSPFSNRGQKTVHLAAPGLEVYNTVLDGEYKSLGGTAAAVGHVAGVAGLIASRWADSSNDQIKTRILSGVTPLPGNEADRVATGGILNAHRSLEEDNVAPGQPAGLRLEQLSNRGFKLGWTAMGEDGCAGAPATRYELRYSTSPIEEEGGIDFDLASRSGVSLSRPGAVGSREQGTVTLSPSGANRRLNVALAAVDNVGNRSTLARAIVDVPGVPVVFEEQFEAGSPGWIAEGTWAMTELPGRGKVWTDSPGGSYQDSRNDSLNSPWIPLRGWRDCKLHFESRHTIEKEHDGCKLEVRSKDGSWVELANFDGHSDWTNREFDLSFLNGKEIQVRFRLQTDDSRTSDGIYVDNFVITGRKTTEEEPPAP